MSFTKGFSDALLRQRHFDKHRLHFQVLTALEYEALADQFLGGPLPQSAFECERANGDVVRYDPTTNEFGILCQHNCIVTYYKPTGLDRRRYPTNYHYWRRQCLKNDIHAPCVGTRT